MKIAFYKGWASKWYNRIDQFLIRFWTRGKYCHVELIDTNEYQDSRKWTWYAASSYDTGLSVKRTIHFNPEKWDVYDLSDSMEDAIKWLDENIGVKYDYKGVVLSHFLNLGIENDDKFFCSEFIAHALQQTDVLLDDVFDSSFYSPVSLHKRLKFLGKIYGTSNR